MKTVKFLVLALGVVMFASCGDATKTVTGVIGEGTSMNNIDVRCENGEILTLFKGDNSKINAGTEGLLIGDTVSVKYGEGNVIKTLDFIARGTAMTCDGQIADVVGDWVETVEVGDKAITQGVELKADGSAKSINMATLVYEAWIQEGDELTLMGKSVGNNQTIDFKEPYKIMKCDADSLVLEGNAILRFARKAE